LNNSQVFTQQYGYFEMRAELPSAPGTWPAFWMLQPVDHTGETDVMEMFGSHDSYSTALSSTLGYTYRYGNYIPDSDTSFHTYGVLWTPATMTFYVDRVAIGSTATPSDMQGPMYMIMNLAMGGSAGSPAPDFTSAQMKIDYVHAYSLGGGGGTPTSDTLPPAIAFNTVSFVDTGTAGDNTTNNGAVTLSGTASDNVGVATVDVYNGATLLGHAGVDNTAHTWSLSTVLGNGIYDHLTAVASDAAGNSASASTLQSLHVDLVPPTVSFGAVSSTSNPAVTFSGTVSDDTSVAGVDVFNGTTLLGHASVDSVAKTWSLSTTLANGTYSQLAATATDEAGNTTTAAGGQSITITAPSPAINSDIRNSDGSFTVGGTCEAGSSVSVHDSGTLLGTSHASSSGSWSFTSAPLANSIHDFSVTATDAAGNVGLGTNSAVYGTTGNDVITSVAGSERLTGGGGADRFDFTSTHFGNDVITDFSPSGRNHDVVEFSKSVFTDYSSVIAHASQSGGDVVIKYDGADTVTLLGVQLNKLAPGDFHFL
jgi:Ca2+-binding RTX toxin-like protein